ncbi:MAG: pyrroline-5-carboxylate reductase [Gammaproteobacteria bacterium]
MHKFIIGFIGGGNMAHCLIKGLLSQGHAPHTIWVSNPNPRENLEPLGVNITTDNTVVAEKAGILVFAVKPQILPHVARELAPVLQVKHPCIISLAAGVRIASLQAWLGSDMLSIARAMPNTPAIIGYGATGLYANAQVTLEQKKEIKSLFDAVGITFWLDRESQLDTVTALSGSGPAYFFLVIEALIQASVDLGLPEETAKQLAIQTAKGAAHLAGSTSESLAQLRAHVTSPGGTTEHAIHALEAGEIRVLFAHAIRAAQQRAVALGEPHVICD